MRRRINHLVSFCGRKNYPLPVGPPDMWDWTQQATSIDQLEIEEWLETEIYPTDVLLHVGIGNSSLAKRLAHKLLLIIGTTLSSNELSSGESLGIQNYEIHILNKYGTRFPLLLNKAPRYIVDNNLGSYACCNHHLVELLRSYRACLDIGGMIITHEYGWGWTSNPCAAPLSYHDLTDLAKQSALTLGTRNSEIYTLIKS